MIYPPTILTTLLQIKLPQFLGRIVLRKTGLSSKIENVKKGGQYHRKFPYQGQIWQCPPLVISLEIHLSMTEFWCFFCNHDNMIFPFGPFCYG